MFDGARLLEQRCDRGKLRDNPCGLRPGRRVLHDCVDARWLGQSLFADQVGQQGNGEFQGRDARGRILV